MGTRNRSREWGIVGGSGAMTSKGKDDKVRGGMTRAVEADAVRGGKSEPPKSGTEVLVDPLAVPEFDASDDSISLLLDTIMEEEDKTKISPAIPPQPFRKEKTAEPKRRSSWYPPYEPIHATLDEIYLVDDEEEPESDETSSSGIETAPRDRSPGEDQPSDTKESEKAIDDFAAPGDEISGDFPFTREDFAPPTDSAPKEDEALVTERDQGSAEPSLAPVVDVESQQQDQPGGPAEKDEDLLEEVELGFDTDPPDEEDTLNAETSLDADYLFGEEASHDDKDAGDDEPSFDDTEETTELSLFAKDDLEEDTLSVSMSLGSDEDDPEDSSPPSEQPLFPEEQTRRVAMDPSLLERSKESDSVVADLTQENTEESDDVYDADEEVTLARFNHENRSQAGSSVSLTQGEERASGVAGSSGVGGYIKVGRSDDDHSVVEVEARVAPVAVDVVELSRTLVNTKPSEPPASFVEKGWNPPQPVPEPEPEPEPEPAVGRPETPRFGVPTLAMAIVTSLVMGAVVGLVFAYFGPMSRSQLPRSPQVASRPGPGSTPLVDGGGDDTERQMMLIPSVEVIGAPADAGSESEPAAANEEALDNPDGSATSAPEILIDGPGGLPAGATTMPEEVVLPIVFQAGQSHPAGVDEAEMQRIAAIMTEDRSFQVELIGHAGAEDGMPSWRARQLAGQRAEAVVDIFRAQGPSQRRFLPRRAREGEVLPATNRGSGPQRAVVLKVMPRTPRPLLEDEN